MKIGQTLGRATYWLALAAMLAARLEAVAGQAQAPENQTQLNLPEAKSPESEEHPPAISLSPAVISVKGKPWQTFSQDLTLSNNTIQELAFQMEARDVVVRDGKRVFLPAGEVEGGIARYAVFTDTDVVVL